MFNRFLASLSVGIMFMVNVCFAEQSDTSSREINESKSILTNVINDKMVVTEKQAIDKKEVPKVADKTPAQLLQASDIARGGQIDGISIESTLTAYKNGKAGTHYAMLIESIQNKSLITFLEPARSKGILMLIKERNMWFISSDVRKPVPISPRQRLTGGANNGDIATANYSRDYDAELFGEEIVDGILCYVLNLSAKSKRVTYDKITYYIDKESYLGKKAEYYTVSGKHLKTAHFEYDNRLQHKGKTIRFVSKMILTDELKNKNKTVLTYKNVEIKKIARSRFNLNLLSKH